MLEGPWIKLFSIGILFLAHCPWNTANHSSQPMSRINHLLFRWLFLLCVSERWCITVHLQGEFLVWYMQRRNFPRKLCVLKGFFWPVKYLNHYLSQNSCKILLGTFFVCIIRANNVSVGKLNSSGGAQAHSDISHTPEAEIWPQGWKKVAREMLHCEQFRALKICSCLPFTFRST